MSKNLILLTMSRITDIEHRSIYTDLLRKFRDEGWGVYVVTPHERSLGMATELIHFNANHYSNWGDSSNVYSGKGGSTNLTNDMNISGEPKSVHILGVKTLNLQKTNIIEKGVGQVTVEMLYKNAIKKYFNGIDFDLILYSTPPITFPNVISYLKEKNPRAISYLLLKDIFPQNAVDMGMFSKRSPFWWYFRKKEIALYKVSDYIGCMSPANVNFVRRHNPYYPAERVEVAPNSISLSPQPYPLKGKGDIQSDSCVECEDGNVAKWKIREKYGLPTDRPIFIYGGNLGKPQGIPFLIKCLEANKNRKDCHFLIVGNGTEYNKLHTWHESLNEKLKEKNEKCNITLMQRLPKEDYDKLVRACDVGLIFLDHRFTIPNYPSRLLSYLEYKMPVLCATDRNTDIGCIAKMNGYGLWCESINELDFTVLVDWFVSHPESIKEMGERGYEYLKQNYLVENTYNIIMQHFE